MTKIDIKYELKFESPFHCGTGLAEGLIDRTVMRDQKEYLYIPGSTIKGVLRETCERIAKIYGLTVRDVHNEAAAAKSFTEQPDITEVIFGSRFREGALFFDPAVMADKSKRFFNSSDKKRKNEKPKYLFMQTEHRTQTAISRRTGIVKKQALYTSEFGISSLYFEGKIHGHLKGMANEVSDLPGPFSLFLLVAGLAATERIGANRSVGMGRCRFEITDFQVDDQTQQSQDYIKGVECLLVYKDAKEEQTS